MTALLLLLSATIFPIGHLYDPTISPKWYATVLAVMMVAVRTAWIRKNEEITFMPSYTFDITNYVERYQINPWVNPN